MRLCWTCYPFLNSMYNHFGIYEYLFLSSEIRRWYRNWLVYWAQGHSTQWVQGKKKACVGCTELFFTLYHPVLQSQFYSHTKKFVFYVMKKYNYYYMIYIIQYSCKKVHIRVNNYIFQVIQVKIRDYQFGVNFVQLIWNVRKCLLYTWYTLPNNNLLPFK